MYNTLRRLIDLHLHVTHTVDKTKIQTIQGTPLLCIYRLTRPAARLTAPAHEPPAHGPPPSRIANCRRLATAHLACRTPAGPKTARILRKTGQIDAYIAPEPPRRGPHACGGSHSSVTCVAATMQGQCCNTSPHARPHAFTPGSVSSPPPAPPPRQSEHTVA